MNIVSRSIHKPLTRADMTFDERWNGDDKGLITAWEVGRAWRDAGKHESVKACHGALPVLLWKGGVRKKLKDTDDGLVAIKHGCPWYLAQWQGLRGEDLNIDLNGTIEHTCTTTGQIVIFTNDPTKWSIIEFVRPALDGGRIVVMTSCVEDDHEKIND